ncbi:MAG TPA: DapH/DapD/GlmU-related protein [Thermoanaerobaculia bacterium]|nr:DapH/DapD/GlmU-related protein [Thermoanaerobaculia bacterium]
MPTPHFHPLVPGVKLEGDWFPGAIPSNIRVGRGCVVDSSFCFKHFFARGETGLVIGDDVTFWRTSLAVEENGRLEIGDQCYLSNASIVCATRITLGSRVFVAGGATIADADFHPLEPAARLADTIALSPAGDRTRRPAMTARAVTIGDDVWIGYNAVILKGVVVGDGAVVAPGAVVLRDVGPGAYVAGNPAAEVGPKLSAPPDE